MTHTNSNISYRTDQSLLAEYFRIAKPKLIKAFIYSVGVFAGVMYMLGGILFFAKRNDKSFDSSGASGAALWVIIVAIGLGFFVVILAVAAEYIELRRQRKNFEKQPFSVLAKSGFERVRILENSLWKIYKEVQVLKTATYIVVADSPAKGRVSCTLLTHVDVDNIPIVSNPHPCVSFSRSPAGLLINVRVDDFNTPSTLSLMRTFEIMADWLTEQGYEPQADLLRYEAMIKDQLLQQGIKGGLGV